MAFKAKGFWQHLWEMVIEICGDNEESLVVYKLTMFSAGIYWFCGLILYSLNFLAFFKRFKVQPNKIPDRRKVFKVSENGIAWVDRFLMSSTGGSECSCESNCDCHSHYYRALPLL